MRAKFRRALGGLVVVTLLTSTGTWALFARDMRRAHDRIRHRGSLVVSPFGDIEFTEGGSGPPVLVVHGSGGGFDQGELIAQAVLGSDVHWVAPSRFGYLGSTFRPGSTFDDQAHAYACLLDHLGIPRAAVVALSHGGPSALLFAALHPDRVTSLTLISAGVASSTDENQADANRKGDALTAIFQRDFRYWAATKLFRKRLLDLMGVSAPVIASMAPAQRELADEIIDLMNPVSRRSAGVIFDNTAAMPNGRIAAVLAPTLILHARDDQLQLYRNAQFAARAIRGSRLIGFERGGHFVVIVEQAAIRELIRGHILAHARE